MMSIVGRFSGLKPGSTYRRGPIGNGEAYFEKKGSVIMFFPSILISKVLWPIQVIVFLSFCALYNAIAFSSAKNDL